MRRSVFLFFVIVMFGSISAVAQIEQVERARERMERAVRADEARRRNQPENANDPSALPKPKPAVMNVNVQTVLTKSEYKSFAEAKPNAIAQVADGDPLWLYVKFNGKLGDYVLTLPDPERANEARYLLYAEVGPQNDVTTLNQYVIEFKKEDLAAQELKINLAPGLQGRNKAIPVFLVTSASGRPGTWHNEIRLTNNTAFPRALTDNLAKSPLTVEFPGGPVKYRGMESVFDSIAIRGTADISRIPAAGSFFDEKLKTEITAELRNENIAPARLYFAGDGWAESASFSPEAKRSRKMYAVFTYKRGESCFYGTAQAVQIFDAMKSAFGETAITLQKDLLIPCAQLN